MLAQVLRLFGQRSVRGALLMLSAAALSSCATKEEPQLVSTGADRESSLPWNEQQKWENKGQFGPMAERFEGGR